MSVTDLLFNGSPPPSVTSYGTSTQNLPQWYSDYVQGVMSAGNAVAAEPYQQYGGPRIADFTEPQTHAFDEIKQMQGAFDPTLGDAILRAQTGSNTNPGSAAQPFFDQAQASNPSAAASGLIGHASGLDAAGAAQPALGRAANMDPANAASNFLGQASELNPSAAASGYLGSAASLVPASAAANYFGTAANLSPSSAASGYLANASQSAPDVIDKYMNPYTNDVVNRIGALAGRNLSENLLPAIGDNFIRGGQFGSSRMQEMTGRALRDTQESALAAEQSALQQGYGQAQTAAQTDLARQGQLGQTAGSLASQEQQNLANIGTSTGNLTAQQQNALANIGATTGNLTAQQQKNLADIGATTGSLTAQGQQNLTNIGQVTGNLTNAEQSNLGSLASTTGNLASAHENALANMGQAAGNLQNAYNTNLVNAATVEGNLGMNQQSMKLKDAAALQDVGAQQQGLNQANLNTAYQDFQNQVQYPKDQLGFESNLVRGFQIPTSTSGSSTSPQTTNMVSGAQSGLTSLASGLSGLSGILGKAKGGRVVAPPRRKPASAGALAMAKRKPTVGALALARR